jgi:hypothetical protein
MNPEDMRMTASRHGVVSGRTITLDADVPPLEGKRVRVLIETAEDSDLKIQPDEQARLWQQWMSQGPQGPLGEEDLADLP